MHIKKLKLILLLMTRNIREEKLFSFLSIIGIALGIALYISVQSATDKAIKAFSTDIAKLNPYTNVEITPDTGTFLDENLYADLLNSGEEVFPVLMTKAINTQQADSINLYGIDVLKTWHAVKPKIDITTLNLAPFFNDQTTVIAPSFFANKNRLATGDSFQLSLFDKSYRFILGGIYNEKEMGADGLIIDIAHFQDLFGLAGKLSWIEMKTDTPNKIAAQLPQNVTLQTKASVIQQKEQIISSFKHNLQFISFIAILVGFFLLFNTVFISIVKKRTQIGILRSLGMKTREILILFVGFGLILGTFGTVLGILLGQLVTGITLQMTEKTVSSIYSMVKLSANETDWPYIFQAIILGMSVSFISAILPAIEAAKIKPNETAREGSFENRYTPYYKPVAALGCILIVIGLAFVYKDYRFTTGGMPLFSYIGILLVILGFTITAPFYLTIMNASFSKLFTPLRSPALMIASGNVRGSISRFSIALVSVAISTALIVSMFVLIHSFRSSFKVWIDDTLKADIYIKPASCLSNFCYEPLSPDLLYAVMQQPEVENVNPFAVMKGKADGVSFMFGFGDKKVVSVYHDKPDNHMDPALISITEQVSNRLNKKAGDTITIETPSGMIPFKVGEVFTTYSTTEGLIIFDTGWMSKLWQQDYYNQLSIYTQKGTDVAVFADRLELDILKGYSLELLSNAEIRTKVLNIFDKSFAMTYAIQLIAFIVSLIGIINTLTAIVIENQREISVLRYVGTRFDMIKRIYISSAAITALSGVLMGSVIGGILSVILVKVINAISFGWTIHFHVPIASLFGVLAILLIMVILSGMIPISLIRKIDPKKYISFE